MRLSSHTTPKSLLDADIAESARRTADLVQSDGTNWAVEELVAMKFAYIKHLAELVANDKVTEVVVPVPPPNSNATPSRSPVFVLWPSTTELLSQ